MQNEKLQQSQTLLNKFSWSIIPVGPDKKPLIPWKEYQTRRPTPEELKQWFNQFPDANIAVVTGKISNLTVVDIDPQHDGTDKPFTSLSTVKSATPSGGWHYYFKYDPDIRSTTGLRPGIDIRSEGGYVVLPPSINANSKSYKWLLSPFTGAPILNAPHFLKVWQRVNTLQSRAIQTENPFKGVAEGNRNTRGTELVGKLLYHMPSNTWESTVWPLIENWNKQNKPPLDEKELRSMFESIANKEYAKSQVKTQIKKPLSFTDLMAAHYEEETWLVDSLIPSEGIIAISGIPASYKTWFVLEMAIAISSGIPLFDTFKTIQTGVLLVDEESGCRLLQKRLKLITDRKTLPISVLPKTGFKLTQQSAKEILSFAKENKIGLIVFDSLVRIHNARDENDALQMAAVFSLMQSLTVAGITVIFIHHNRKQGASVGALSQSMRGSSDILAAVDCHIAVERDENELTIIQTKLRNAEENKPFKIKLIQQENKIVFEYLGKSDKPISIKDSVKQGILDILSISDEPLNKETVLSKLGETGVQHSRSTFKTVMAQLIEEGVVHSQKGVKNEILCSIKPFVGDG